MADRNAAPRKREAHVTDETLAEREPLQGVSGDAIGPRTPIALDQLIHERVRLGIVSALAVHPSLSFNELKSLLALSDGNLSVHARRLEAAEYIACTKSFDGRIPRTEYSLLPLGREALERYINHMEALIQAVRQE